MAARKPCQLTTMTGEDVEKKKEAPKACKSTQPAPTKHPKPAKKKTSKSTSLKKIHKGKRSDHLVNEEDEEGKPTSDPQVENDEYNLQRDSTNDAKIAADMEQSNNETDIEILNVVEERGKEVSNTVALEEKTAGPNPEPMHEDFTATLYPEVHKSLKLTIEEQVYIENQPSSSRTLSSMKNLKDAFTFGDQFLNDKLTEEESGKANLETEVESISTVPIHQASLSVPLLSTPIIDLSPPKPVLPPIQEPIFTTTTTTTTILLPPLPPPL
nr:hypothetical protein [Tanacetum cinerariifolium]